MSIDAMKQALEALEAAHRTRRPELIKQAITSLRLAIQKEEALSALIAESQALGAYDVPKAERQEPVAWWREDGSICIDESQAGESDIPLYTDRRLIPRDYTAPPQRLPDYVWCGCGDGIMPNTGAKCGTCASIDAAPPQRQPLTDAEAWETFEQARAGSSKPVGILRGIRAIERKHGIGGEHD